MTKPTKPEFVDFDIQEIPLQEAQFLAMSAVGKYGALVANILQRMPNLPPDKSLAFAVPNGKEVEEKDRRGLCMTLGRALSRAGLQWKCTYSSERKLFVLVPLAGGRAEFRPVTQKLGRSRGPYKKRKPTDPGNGKMDDAKAKTLMASIVMDSCKLFKVTPEQIVEGKRRAKAVRKAICRYAYDRNVAPRIIGPYVGISESGVKFNAHQNTGFGVAELAKLRSVIGG